MAVYYVQGCGIFLLLSLPPLSLRKIAPALYEKAKKCSSYFSSSPPSSLCDPNRAVEQQSRGLWWWGLCLCVLRPPPGGRGGRKRTGERFIPVPRKIAVCCCFVSVFSLSLSVLFFPSVSLCERYVDLFCGGVEAGKKLSRDTFVSSALSLPLPSPLFSVGECFQAMKYAGGEATIAPATQVCKIKFLFTKKSPEELV